MKEAIKNKKTIDLAPRLKQILLAFSKPSTPRQVERSLGITKLKMEPYIEKGLLKSLNPTARKGRLYNLTNKSRKIMEMTLKTNSDFDWDLMGWFISSPKQRYAVLKTMSLDTVKRTSENIRCRASGLNNHLTRISTKRILNELIQNNLVNSEIKEDRKRYYWISEKGKSIFQEIEKIGFQESQ